MIIRFNDFTLDTALFEEPVYVRDFDMIAWTTRKDLVFQPVTLYLQLETTESARETAAVIMNGLRNGASRLDLAGTACEWPKKMARRLYHYLMSD